MEDSVSIRMLRVTGQETTRIFARTTKIAEVIESLKHDWPAGFGTLQPKSEVKFVHGGKFLEPGKSLADMKFSTTDPTTVHVVVKEGLPQRAVDVGGLNGDAHLHGMIFDEEEFVQTNQIFRDIAKRSPDGKMHFAQLGAFLQKYWRFIMIGQYVSSDQKFPAEKLRSLWRQVTHAEGTEGSIDINQFRSIFFLFTTTGSDEICAHGHRQRVLEATQQFHTQLKTRFTELPAFQPDLFDSAFAMADLDSDGTLSCAESELLFHLYSCAVIERSGVPEVKVAADTDTTSAPPASTAAQ